MHVISRRLIGTRSCLTLSRSTPTRPALTEAGKPTASERLPPPNIIIVLLAVVSQLIPPLVAASRVVPLAPIFLLP